MYDLIGDIHGHADELVQLLEKLDYRRIRGVYRHPERKVVFLGDYIDRGPKIRQVLEIVRPMVEEERAWALMGNHELNALAFHTEIPDRPGAFFRKRTTKNIRQHAQTIIQLNDEQFASTLDWFRTLPMWLELDGLRAVHACWDDDAIHSIARATNEHGGTTPALFYAACQKESGLFTQVELVLKGRETKLPNGISYRDREGHPRYDVRTRWYESPVGHTYRSYSLASEIIECDLAIDASMIAAAKPYPTASKPVFLGHYWLSADRPEILAPNVACLDYSVAKNGFLCAYRWQGEQQLSNENFVWVDRVH